MLTTYEGILHGNVIEWRNDAPSQAIAGEAVNVYVTVLEPPADKKERGKRMAEALERISKSGALANIDPLAWEREVRNEAPLIGRRE